MKLLITGGKGTIGKEITILSLLEGIDVNILTRNKSLKSKKEGLKYFYWNPDNKFIDHECIEGVDIPRFRQLSQDQVDAANDAFERAFQKRLEEGKNFKMFKIEGYIPQIIGEEEASELIRE